MKRSDRDTTTAIILIGLGVLFLLGRLGIFGALAQVFWGAAFLLGAGAFLWIFQQDRRKWWALIPGFALLALAGAVSLGDLSGSAFLGILGAGFLAVYLTGKQRWWAIIPGGTLLSLALVAGSEELFPRWDGGPLLFLGLAATFTALYLLPEGEGRQRWAVFPAGACLLLVVLSSGFVSGFGTIGLPLLLIAAGAYLMWQRRPAASGPREPRTETALPETKETKND